MRFTFLALLLFPILLFGQDYYLIKNSKKTQSIFNLEDNNSLMSILQRNKWIFGPSGAIYNDELNNPEGFSTGHYTLTFEGSPWQGIFQGQQIEYYTDFQHFESFDSWVNDYVQRDFDASGVGPNWIPDILVQKSSPEFEAAWYVANKSANQSGSDVVINSLPKVMYFDFRNIDAIIVKKNSKDSTYRNSDGTFSAIARPNDRIYFVQKSEMKDKWEVVYNASLEDVLMLKANFNSNCRQSSYEPVSDYVELKGVTKDNVITMMRQLQMEEMNKQDGSPLKIIDSHQKRETEIGKLYSEPLVGFYQGQEIWYMTDFRNYTTYEDWINFYMNSDYDALMIGEKWFPTHNQYLSDTSVKKAWDKAMETAITTGTDQPIMLEKTAIFWNEVLNPAVYLQMEISKGENSFNKIARSILICRSVGSDLGQLYFDWVERINSGVVPALVFKLDLFKYDGNTLSKRDLLVDKRNSMLNSIISTYGKNNFNYEWEKVFSNKSLLLPISKEQLSFKLVNGPID